MSIYEMLKNASYKEALIDSMCDKKTSNSEFRDIIEYVLNHKLEMFKEFDRPLYPNDDNITVLILPSIRRVWGNTFITPPQLLKDDKLEIFKLLFDIDEFLKYVLDMLETKFSMEVFEYLDRSCELLKLIVDNYIAMNFNIAYNIVDIDSKLKELKRNKKINKIVNGRLVY